MTADVTEATVTKKTSNDAVVLHDIINSFQLLDDDNARERMLQTIAVFFGIKLGTPHPPNDDVSRSQKSNSTASGMVFSDHQMISPKAFMADKAPASDVERVACLAYYLTHHRDMPYFKTLDISTLNTEAAQYKFSNAAVAVNNATLQQFLVAASKGSKQLSAAGEQFVKALPDREQAKAIFQRMRSGRLKRKSPKKK